MAPLAGNRQVQEAGGAVGNPCSEYRRSWLGCFLLAQRLTGQRQLMS
jgi:hypothetical protein